MVRTWQRAATTGILMAAIAAGCGCPTTPQRTLRITAPAADERFNRADDLVPDTDGVQVEFEVAAEGLDGTSVTIVAATGTVGAAGTAVIEQSSARVMLTLAGDATFVARATPAEGDPVDSAPVAVTFDDAPRACRILLPKAGATLGADADAGAADGFQADVRVRCAGVEVGNTGRLLLDGAPAGEAVLGSGGLASFAAVELVEGENTLVFVIETNAGEEVRTESKVTVATGACRVVLAPPTGTVFNARGEGGHASVVADRVPGAPMNARLELTAGCPGATLEVRRGTTVVASGTAGEGPLVLEAELPDGTLDLRAHATGTAQGASTRVRWEVDAVVPTAEVTFPLAGVKVGDGDDRSEAPGLQLPVRGRFTGIGAGRPFQLVLVTGDGPATTIDGVLGDDETFDLLVTLPNGDHVLEARATRPLGTVAASAPVVFESLFLGGSVAIATPADAEKFPLARDAEAGNATFDVPFSLVTTGLAGATGTVDCGGASAAFTVGDDGRASATVAFLEEACGGASPTCVAIVTSAGGARFESAPVTLLVDARPPELTLLEPARDATLRTNLLTVRATAACAGEPVSAVLERNGVVVAGPVPAVDGAVVLPDVALPSGQSTVVLRVTDPAGNQTIETITVFVDPDAPVVTWLEPAAGSAPVFGPDDDQAGDLTDGLQRTLSVAVDNEAAGTLVELRVGGRAAMTARTATVGASRVATFPQVELPEGTSALQACAIDEAGGVGCDTITVQVTTGRVACAVGTPLDGTLLGLDDDASEAEGFQTTLEVLTGAPTDAVVALSLTGSDGIVRALQASVADGKAVFAATTLPVDGIWTLEATCAPGEPSAGRALPSRFTVDTTPPTADVVDPAEGAVLNAAAPDRGTEAGFQIDVRVLSSEPGPGTASLRLDCGAGPGDAQEASYGTDQVALFQALTVPDEGDCSVTVSVLDPAGNRGPEAVRRFRVDRVAPVVRIIAPLNGRIYGAAADANSARAGFDLSELVAEVVDATGTPPASLRVGTATVAEGTFTALSAGVTRARWREVPLPEGRITLAVTSTDAAGNSATASIEVTVDTHGPVVSIANLSDGLTLRGAADTDPVAEGHQQNVQLAGEKLVSGTTVRICSVDAAASAAACQTGAGRVLAEATLSDSTAVVTGVTLPEGSITIYAEAIDLAGNQATSAPIRLTVDSFAPIVQTIELFRVSADGTVALDPAAGAATFGPAQDASTAAGFQTRVRATLTGLEAGRTVVFYSTNPTVNTTLGSAPVNAAGVAEIDATLAEGGHRLHAYATDLVGNPSSTPESPTAGQPPTLVNFAVDLTPPTLTLVAPQPGTLLARHDLVPNVAGEPATLGLQYDVLVASDAGAGRIVTVTVDGVTAGSGPLGTDGAAAVRVTLADGGPRNLAVEVSDAAGNGRSAGPVALTIDSVAPRVTLVRPAGGETFDVDEDPAASGFQVDVNVTYSDVGPGRPIVLLSSVVGTLASGTTDASGAALFRATMPNGAQTLRVRITDGSGNVTTTAPASFTVDFGAPSIQFVSAENPLYFGVADDTDAAAPGCQVTVQALCDIPGATAVLLKDGLESAPQTVADGGATFAGVQIPAGGSVELQLRASDASNRTGFSATRTAFCDLAPPTISLTAPATATAKYVAAGNPGNVANAIEDKVATPQLEADFTVTVGGATDGTVTLSSSLDGAIATAPVAADGAITFSSAVIPSGGVHTLTFRVTDLAGNTATATLTATVDVQAPGAANAAATILDPRRTRVRLAFPAPGGDGAGGAKVSAYVVRRADAAITSETQWAAATAVTPTAVTVADPGAAQELLVEGLLFERDYHFAVRAVDALGNLGPIGTSPRTDLRLVRQYLSLGAGTCATDAPNARLVMGDLDGDGRDDLVVGCASFDSLKGKIVIWYGGATPVGPIEILSPARARFGVSIVIADITGDGRNELIVGSPNEATGANAAAMDGAVYVWRGQPNVRLASGSLATLTNYTKIVGRMLASDVNATTGAPLPLAYSGLGAELAVGGDLDADGIADLVTSAPSEDAGKGSVYVFKGRATWPATLDGTTGHLARLVTSFVATNSGPAVGNRLVPMGDLDGDGAADFAASAPRGTLPDNGAGQSAPRPVFVVSGRLARGNLGVEAISTAVYAAPPTGTYLQASRFGLDIAGGDVTGDGKSELAVYDGNDGKVSFFSGAELGALLPASVGEVPRTAPVDGSAARVAGGNIGSGGGTLTHHRNFSGDGLGEFFGGRGGANFPNEGYVWFGRSEAAFRAVTGDLPMSLVLRRVDTTQEGARWAARNSSGHFVTGTTGPRDIAVLDTGSPARITILHGPATP